MLSQYFSLPIAMKLLFLTILCTVLALPITAQTRQRSPKTQAETRKAKPELSITIINEKEPLYAGDSILVTYRLRSLLPLNGIRMLQAPTLKGVAGWRELSAHYPRLRQVTEQGQVYYTLDIAYFVVSPTAVGTLVIAEGIFEAEVITGETQSHDPFDMFFGNGIHYTTERHRVKSPKHTIRVTTAPLRSTKEVLQRGGRLL